MAASVSAMSCSCSDVPSIAPMRRRLPLLKPPDPLAGFAGAGNWHRLRRNPCAASSGALRMSESLRVLLLITARRKKLDR